MPYGNPDLGSYRLCRLTKDIMPWSKDVQYQFLSSEESVRGKVAMESAGLSAATLPSFRFASAKTEGSRGLEKRSCGGRSWMLVLG